MRGNSSYNGPPNPAAVNPWTGTRLNPHLWAWWWLA